MSKLIYLDNNSTTPVDPAVFESMRPYFTEFFGNPSNQQHAAGSEAARAVERARSQVAAVIGAQPNSIIFTSGATESNNLAILGVCRALRTSPGHIVTSLIEHKAVTEPCRHLEKTGWKVTYLRPDSQGTVNWQAIEDSITTDTVLVSIMAANNEIGTIQPVEQIGEICEKRGVFFHCDAAQALGRMPIDVDKWNVDLLSLSAHKAYGPKGTGALFVREQRKASLIAPLCYGGGQEQEIRPGTLAVPNIVGFGAACELALLNLAEESKRIGVLRQSLLDQLLDYCPDMVVHGHTKNFLPGLLSVGYPGVDGDEFLFRLQDVAISQGAACSSGSPEPSHVLKAIGVEYELARSSFRFGIGRFNTIEEISTAAAAIKVALSQINQDTRKNL